MSDLLWAIAIAVATSFIASIAFLCVMACVRPRLEISSVIAQGIRDGSVTYNVKVVNRSRVDLFDVRAVLESLEVIPDAQGDLGRRTSIRLRTPEILLLPRYDKRDSKQRYAFRFNTSEDIKDVNKGKDTKFRFQIIATHGISGFSRAFSCYYTHSDIKPGNFRMGKSFDLADLNDDHAAQLRAHENGRRRANSVPPEPRVSSDARSV